MNAPAAAALAAPQLTLSLIGVPNCGKTALFNRLTGSRQKVANYPGVTVERKEGRLTGPRSGRTFRVIDLPGAYSLEPATLDEAIARDVVLGRHATEPAPDLLVCVVDATNLRLNLRLVLELKRLGKPIIVALNMSDLAAQRGYTLDRAALERALGVPVVPTVAVRSGGRRAAPTSKPPSAKCAACCTRPAIAYPHASRCCRGSMRWCSIPSRDPRCSRSCCSACSRRCSAGPRHRRTSSTPASRA